MSIIEEDPSLALQGAQVAALKADAGLAALGLGARVYDNVPPQVTFPFIQVGDDVVTGFDSPCGSDSEIVSTVRVFSRGVGRVEAKRLAERVRFILTEEAGFAVSGWRMPVAAFESVRFERHSDGHTTQAILEFRYRLTPAP